MAIDFSNYINTYKGSSVLQQQFPNMNDYLALFGYNQGTTPSAATTSTATTTPTATAGIPNIINQNINQYQSGGDGPRGGGAFGNLDMSTAKEFNIDGKTVTGYKNLGTGLYQDFKGKNIQNLGIRNFGLAGVLEGIFGKGKEPEYPGLFDKVSFSALVKNPGLYKSFFDRQDVAKQKAIQDAIDAYNRAELAKLEQERQAAANRAGLSSTTTQGGGGGIASAAAAAAGAAAGMGGGSRQATSAGSMNTGRQDGGWGWADGGSVDDYEEPESSKLVKYLMDVEGYTFGEAVKEAMRRGFENGGPIFSEEDFPKLLNPFRPSGQKPGLSNYDDDVFDYDYEIPMGGEMKKPKKKKKKKDRKDYSDGGRVYLYDRLK